MNLEDIERQLKAGGAVRLPSGSAAEDADDPVAGLVAQKEQTLVATVREGVLRKMAEETGVELEELQTRRLKARTQRVEEEGHLRELTQAASAPAAPDGQTSGLLQMFHEDRLRAEQEARQEREHRLAELQERTKAGAEAPSPLDALAGAMKALQEIQAIAANLAPTPAGADPVTAVRLEEIRLRHEVELGRLRLEEKHQDQLMALEQEKVNNDKQRHAVMSGVIADARPALLAIANELITHGGQLPVAAPMVAPAGGATGLLTSASPQCPNCRASLNVNPLNPPSTTVCPGCHVMWRLESRPDAASSPPPSAPAPMPAPTPPPALAQPPPHQRVLPNI